MKQYLNKKLKIHLTLILLLLEETKVIGPGKFGI